MKTGGIAAKAGTEIETAAHECLDGAALRHNSAGEVLNSDKEHWSFARRRPLEVVGVLSLFNFPLILPVRSVTLALALGSGDP